VQNVAPPEEGVYVPLGHSNTIDAFL